jgi:hypothetical protein
MSVLAAPMIDVVAGGLLSANTTVNVIAIGLIVLGIVLFTVTISFWRSAVEDPAVLAPLEVMQDRKFARGDHEQRTQLLNTVRAPDAPVPVRADASSPLLREPLSEPDRPFEDPFPHDDDAVDVVESVDVAEAVDIAERVIDPLLMQQQPERWDNSRRRADRPRDPSRRNPPR